MSVFVCDLCGQRLEEGQRCNSGFHQGPDDPNEFRGRAVRLESSPFDYPWNPDIEAGPSFRGGKLKIRTPNGRLLTIELLLFGAAVKVTNRKIRPTYQDRISPLDFTDDEFDRGFADEVFTYESMDAAWAAVLDWDGKGDPRGWIRHQPSNRRRPGGDASKEYVAA